MFSEHRSVGTKLAALPLDPRVCEEGSTCSGNFLKPAVFKWYRCKENNETKQIEQKKNRYDARGSHRGSQRGGFRTGKDAKEAYTLAGLVLADVLSNCLRSDLTPIQSGRRDKKSSLYNDKYFNRRH